MVKQKDQSQRHDGAEPTSRFGHKRNGLSAELREDLRALIARWGPALKELEKHQKAPVPTPILAGPAPTILADHNSAEYTVRGPDARSWQST